jgi:acetyl-CoA carboxylase biotin carboxylase subunit
VITRVLVANRGEIAVRVIRACREAGLESVAVFSEADRRARHVALADRAEAIGPPPAAQSYLSVGAIIDAARRSGADAIHPGYGFLAESPDLADACEEAGLVFVGPPAPVIARMGSKIEARRIMAAAGVPVVPGETPADQTAEGIARAVARVGYPVLVKASAGGGGKGMRRVDDPAGLAEAVSAARREALAAFDDGTLYVERLLTRPRHVEVQIIADHQGSVVHLFERECSIQRRHQKVVEETPAPCVSPELRARITDAAVQAARAAGYRNAGTIEFLVDPGAGDLPTFYFLEMNTRLQVEHPVTEAVVGVDLVRAQLRVAAGGPLPWPQSSLAQRGHAIEARVYAEAPARGFVPQAGRLLLYREPQMPGIRVDSGVAEGDDVPVHYDPLLAKVVASAESRAHAIARLVTALEDFPILGVETNLPFVLGVLGHERFRQGDVDTAFLDEAVEAILAGSAGDDLPPAVRMALDAHATTAAPAAGARAVPVWDPWDGATRSPLNRGVRP